MSIYRNIPNILSLYRILVFPFIFWSILQGEKKLFIIMLSINLITDILDGFIARKFKLQTEFGARLDSIADIGSYILAFSGMSILERNFINEYKIEFIIIISLYILPQLISFIRFKRPTSFHLYISKVTGYIQGIFIFSYFLIGFSPMYFYFMMTVCCAAYLESAVIVLLIPELRSNVKGIYFMIKEKGRIE